MKLHLHPELLDRLAASYALGTLRGPARRRFEAIAREQATVRAAALIWQSRLASFNELQTSVQPSPTVWTRIDNLLRTELAPKAVGGIRATTVVKPVSKRTDWLQNLLVWRFATVAGALATVVTITIGLAARDNLQSQLAQLQAQVQSAPQVQYVAVLADGQSAASMLVTFDLKSEKLIVQRVGAYREADDKSLQLWALPRAGVPRSLGVLTKQKVLRLNASEGDVRGIPALAISLEPRGGVPSETGPTGPVLFKGALIQKLL
jgi:anti-sigma-K factor RskA